MQGMDCWTGSFANAAGRAQIEKQMKSLEEQLEKKKAVYDSLNIEREREASNVRAEKLSDAEVKLGK
jgi:hypothetical protein